MKEGTSLLCSGLILNFGLPPVPGWLSPDCEFSLLCLSARSCLLMVLEILVAGVVGVVQVEVDGAGGDEAGEAEDEVVDDARSGSDAVDEVEAESLSEGADGVAQKEVDGSGGGEVGGGVWSGAGDVDEVEAEVLAEDVAGVAQKEVDGGGGEVAEAEGVDEAWAGSDVVVEVGAEVDVEDSRQDGGELRWNLVDGDVESEMTVLVLCLQLLFLQGLVLL